MYTRTIFGLSTDWFSLLLAATIGATVPTAAEIDAIFPLEEVPDSWQGFIAKNFEHFGLEAR